MLKIGDFSKLSYISIRMLRYYDQLDILKPMSVDEKSNYRFYSVEQLEVANIIQKLRDLGFSSIDIKDILDKRDTESVDLYFSRREKELQMELQKVQRISMEVRNLKESNLNKISYNVVEKQMTKRKVISLRRKISNYMEEGILWKELYEEIERLHIKIPNNAKAIAIYHDLEYKEENTDIEVQVDVDKDYQSNDKVKFYQMPRMEVASVTFNGSYDKMVEVTKTIAFWLEVNGYNLVQPMFNIFHISPAQEADPNHWITEVCFQIRKEK